VRTPTSAVGKEAQGGNALLSRGSRESSGMSRSTSNQSAAMIQAAALEAIRSMNITSQSNTPPASHGPATTGRSYTNSSGRGDVTHSSGGRGSGSRSYQIAPRTVTKVMLLFFSVLSYSLPIIFRSSLRFLGLFEYLNKGIIKLVYGQMFINSGHSLYLLFTVLCTHCSRSFRFLIVIVLFNQNIKGFLN